MEDVFVRFGFWLQENAKQDERSSVLGNVETVLDLVTNLKPAVVGANHENVEGEV